MEGNNDGYITNILQTWNIIGLPNTESLPKEDLIVRYNDVDYNWTDATTNNNPTGGPIILEFIYNWSRNPPQHYELTDVFDPGYGYQMYAFHNCSLYYPNIGLLGRYPVESRNNALEQTSLKDQGFKLEKEKIDTMWNVTLEFNEPGGAYDNAFLGEKTDASDGQDIYDVPKSPPSFPPYIRAWFPTNFQDPYDELWEEYKHYPDNYKIWNLAVQWVPSDYSSPTTLTISWDNYSFINSEYTSLVLYDIINNINVTDMIVTSSYTFTCPALTLQNYQIICTTNQPPIIPRNPYPNDGTIDVETETNLNWTGGDPDSGDTVTYDIYFGTTSPPLKVMNNQSAATYDPGKLVNITVYYWRIIAYDNHGALASGPIWSFTTKKSKESNVEETNTRRVALNLNYPSQKLFNGSVS